MFVFVKHFQQFVKFHSEMFIARKAKRENKQRKNRCARRVKQQTVVVKKKPNFGASSFCKIKKKSTKARGRELICRKNTKGLKGRKV